MEQKKPEHTMILAAHDLKTVAPQLWETFVRAFDDYAIARCIDAVNTPTDNALVAHGHAQGLLALGVHFRDLDERAAAIQKNRQRQRP